jgi:hypothetical protein
VVVNGGTNPAEQLPGNEDGNKALIEDGRLGMWMGGNGDSTAAKSFGVVNAALYSAPFAKGYDFVSNTAIVSSTARCSQQNDIDTSGSWMYTAHYPIDENATVTGGNGCPYEIANKEGINYKHAGGFQTQNDLSTGQDLDDTLWNLILNTNGLYLETYENLLWSFVKLGTGSLLSSTLPVKGVYSDGIPIAVNGSTALSNTLRSWKNRLLSRSSSFATTNVGTPSLSNPSPYSYTVPIVAGASGTDKFFVNTRACKAYKESATPVVINKVHFN